jgi:hypothetical protein
MVNYNIKSVYLKALITVLSCAHRSRDLGLDSHESFDTKVFDVLENAVVAYAHFVVLLSELLETPLGRHLVFLCVLGGRG